MRLLDDVIGKEILDSSANIVGKVKDIEINNSLNRIESLIIIKKGFSKKIMSSNDEEKIPFENIDHVGDKIILKQDLKDIVDEIINS